MSVVPPGAAGTTMRTFWVGFHAAWACRPRGSSAAVNARRIPGLRAALATVPAGRFEAWVTHNFVLADLAGSGGDSGEGLVLRAAADGAVQVIARLPA